MTFKPTGIMYRLNNGLTVSVVSVEPGLSEVLVIAREGGVLRRELDWPQAYVQELLGQLQGEE